MRSFEKAKESVHNLKLSSGNEWSQYTKGSLTKQERKPDDIPNSPRDVYRNQWTSIHDWLGAGRKAITWRPYDETRDFVSKLNLRGYDDWQAYKRGGLSHLPKKPEDIPFEPAAAYPEWINYADWLGTKNRKRGWRSFEEARNVVRSLKLKSRTDWRKYCGGHLKYLPPKPDDIPSGPEGVYENEWMSWADWLDTKNISPKDMKFLSFIEAREYVHNLHINSQREWWDYCAGKLMRLPPKPSNLPRHADRTYKDEWVSWGDWLGNGNETRWRKNSTF